jgi:hypothetical protein
MLSHLNTLIGFAAVFAILSLLVTGITQLVRTLLGMKTRALIECLERLFGELKDPRRFVAAILSHPSLEGLRGAQYYRVLTDPGATPDAITSATAAILGEPIDPADGNSLSTRLCKFIGLPWPRTPDLDKQTVKDIGQTVYEQIGHLVDYSLDDSSAQIKQWASPLRQALEMADTKRVETLTASVALADVPRPAAGPIQAGAVKPFRGRMWMLATAAFPEAEGKTPPLKTYVAAFHDEADSSASDSFTWRIRVVTCVISFLIAFLIQLDAVKIWQGMANADPDRIAKLEKSALSLAPESTVTGTEAPNSIANVNRTRQDLINEIGALKASNIDLQIRFDFAWLFKQNGEPFLGFLLAVTALSLGAPFWFETLKSSIQLKSAFDKSDNK